MGLTEPRTAVVAESLSVLLTQFQGFPVIEGFVASHAVQAQALEYVFNDLILRSINDSTGVTLDVYGKIVGESRLDRNDDDFRAAIRARITTNKGNGRVDDIIRVLRAAYNADTGYVAADLGGAAIEVRLRDGLQPLLYTPEELAYLMKKATGAGVSSFFHYSNQEESDTFGLSASDSVESDPASGLSDDTETTGGVLSGILKGTR